MKKVELSVLKLPVNHLLSFSIDLIEYGFELTKDGMMA